MQQRFGPPLCSFVPFVIQGLRPAQAHENRFFDLVVKFLNCDFLRGLIFNEKAAGLAASV
jgi:hypothetical protein